MLLGGMIAGEANLNNIHAQPQRPTVAGYLETRIASPYASPQTGAAYVTSVRQYNPYAPANLYLVPGDERLEVQASRVANATRPGPPDAWRTVHLWIKDLITDILTSWDNPETCVFIDCNPSFSIYTELALSAAERLLIPFSADGSSMRAVRAVLALIYGVRRQQSDPQSEFFLQSNQYRMMLPQIYMYIGNRLTQMNNSSASAFKTVVDEIGNEIWNTWQTQPQLFSLHPSGASTPGNRRAFKTMFQYEVNDANTASVVSGALGIPISVLTSGVKNVAGKNTTVNQSQLDKQVPNIQALVASIE
jgi:cellulose biosynthesis protein BcsQ